MKIRKNTKEHSAIFEVLKRHESDKDRNRLVKLFTLKAGEHLIERKPVEDAKDYADFYYNLNYNAILNNLLDKDHLLNKSDEDDDLYYFESNYADYETPFQITQTVEREIETLLKDKKFKARAPKSIEEVVSEKEGKVRKLVHDNIPEIGETEADIEISDKEIEIDEDTNLKEEPKPPVSLEEPATLRSEKDKIDEESRHNEVLEYYNEVKELILPFLKDRPLFETDLAGKGIDPEKQPDWLKTIYIYSGDINGEFMICQNFDHLKWLVENEFYELKGWTSKNKNLKSPDFLILKIISNAKGESEVKKVMESCFELLEICELSGFLIQSDPDVFNLNIPLDGKNDYDTVLKLSDILGRLIIKKAPDFITMNPNEKKSFRIDTSENAIGRTFLIPFSITKFDFSIALPIKKEDLAENMNYPLTKAIEKIKNDQLSYLSLLDFRYNAELEFQKLNRRYGFLLN